MPHPIILELFTCFPAALLETLALPAMVMPVDCPLDPVQEQETTGPGEGESRASVLSSSHQMWGSGAVWGTSTSIRRLCVGGV